MFCPNCGCEYREGFTTCSDCNVKLVDKINEEELSSRQYGFIKIALSTTYKKVVNCLSGKIFTRISSGLYRLFYLFLTIFNFLTFKYISLWVIGPDWEIPVGLVKPIKLTYRYSIICFFMCIILFGFGYKRFRMQTLFIKIITSLWLIVSIGLFFASHSFRNFSKHSINLVMHYWWMGMFLPLTLLVILIYRDFKISIYN